MLIEIHMIQNHSPANLNRDDLGAPKTCIFGDVTRARISSQCLKRSIRRSPEFADALEKDGGVRTRRLIELIARAAVGEGSPVKEEHRKAIRETFVSGGVGLKDDNTFDILFFLPQSAIDEMGAVVRDNIEGLGKKFAEIIGKFAMTPDIALCGRMTEFDATGDFKGLKGKFSVEAALSAAHAFSTHAVINEVDYFTAADDIPGQDAGAAHVNEAMFNSACFYKHFVINFEQLEKNLANDTGLAIKTVECFLKAAVQANPSGKQHAFAAFNFPEGVLVEVKSKNTPVSYANAFADPVPERSERGLIGESIARLGQYAQDLTEGYGIEAKRFWYSPNRRHSLSWVEWVKQEPEKKPEFEEEQPDATPMIQGFDKFGQFVKAVMKEVPASPKPADAAK